MTDKVIGSRAEVMHGTAIKTSGGLTKKHLKYNTAGKIVSKHKSRNAKKAFHKVKKAFKESPLFKRLTKRNKD
jgi:hypothetical protein